MSQENENTGSAQPAEVSKSQAEKEALVSQKAYEEVSRDMHKFKAKAKELEMAVNEYQSQLKAQEEAKMQEQERWKELYEKREAELEQERRKLASIKEQSVRSVKLNALKQEIGGKVRDEYLKFAALDDITVNEDGSVDKDSLHRVANDFRKEHGQLISPSENVNITGQAPSSQPVGEQKVDIKKMSADQLIQYYANLKKQ